MRKLHQKGIEIGPGRTTDCVTIRLFSVLDQTTADLSKKTEALHDYLRDKFAIPCNQTSSRVDSFTISTCSNRTYTSFQVKSDYAKEVISHCYQAFALKIYALSLIPKYKAEIEKTKSANLISQIYSFFASNAWKSEVDQLALNLQNLNVVDLILRLESNYENIFGQLLDGVTKEETHEVLNKLKQLNNHADLKRAMVYWLDDTIVKQEIKPFTPQLNMNAWLAAN